MELRQDEHFLAELGWDDVEGCQAEQQAEHQDNPGAETGQAEQPWQMERTDPYLKAWEEWKERHRKEGLERSNRLEKKEKLENSWNLVKICRDLIRENYSDWQERKISEDERTELQERFVPEKDAIG